MDAKPREVAIALCLLLPIIGIGLYPKIATQTYDIKTTAIAESTREVLTVVAQERSRLYSGNFYIPNVPAAKAPALLGVMDNISGSA
jgi:NAD(P)H-quinone oxidoreductase subunit 4